MKNGKLAIFLINLLVKWVKLIRDNNQLYRCLINNPNLQLIIKREARNPQSIHQILSITKTQVIYLQIKLQTLLISISNLITVTFNHPIIEESNHQWLDYQNKWRNSKFKLIKLQTRIMVFKQLTNRITKELVQLAFLDQDY